MTLNTVLNDAGWWFDLLSDELNIPDTRLIKPYKGLSDERHCALLSGLSEAFSAYDDSLAQLEPSYVADSKVIRDKRSYLGSLKKFRSTDQVSKKLAVIAAAGFTQRNENCKYYQIPRYLRPFMRVRIAQALRFYSDARESVTPRFGPGSVIEGWNPIEKWLHLDDDASRLSYDWWTADRCREFCAGVPYTGCKPCKLLAVPKDWDKPRLITGESSALSYFQQVNRAAMIKSLGLTKVGLFLDGIGNNDPQARHRRLAIQGSRDGMLATLDLSDASDRVSWEQVVSVFPAYVLADLEASRNPLCQVGVSQPFLLHMYAGMGNATTFVVETLMFWAVCHAVADYHRLGKRFVSVYGDDIVVDWQLATLLFQTKAFERCGWKVNMTKSMWRPDSRFRESCGVQAFQGQDVTLFRVFGYRETPKGVLGVASLINRLAGKYPNLASRIWRETSLPNIRNAPPGSASVDLEWELRTRSPYRWNYRGSWLEEYKLQRFIPQEITAAPNSTELLYGCLSRQLGTDTRKQRGRKRLRVVASLPRRGSLQECWCAATVPLQYSTEVARFLSD